MAHRNLAGRALGLRASELVTILTGGDEIIVHRGGGEASDVVRDLAISALAFTPEGKPRIRHDSVLYRAGVQIRVR